MKHILITGGNAGIGKATAIALAKKGNKIIIACRNNEKAIKAVNEIKAASENNDIYTIPCDLSSFDSIRSCVNVYKNQFDKLDVLINNAGLITDKLKLSKDGLELQIGVNHFGHFLLTSELIDLLLISKEPRIINVSSRAHYRGEINFNSFRGELKDDKYDGMAAYSQSKLANVLFTKELVKRYPSICSHCLHPGVVRTEIAQKNDNSKLWKIGWKLFSPFMISQAAGAETSVYLADSQEALQLNGKYFDKKKEKEPSKLANDEELAAKLWDLSEQLINGNS